MQRSNLNARLDANASDQELLFKLTAKKALM